MSVSHCERGLTTATTSGAVSSCTSVAIEIWFGSR